MSFTFERNDIRAWADFSGDMNPIHFDPAASRRLGAPDVIVHGMLPILWARQSIEEISELRRQPADWVTSGVRLKHPIIVGEPLDLAIASSGTGLRFKVSGETEHKLVGNVTWEGRHDSPNSERPRQNESSSYEETSFVLAEELGSLGVSLPWLRAQWVAADAALFARFIGQRVEPLREAATAFLRQNGKRSDALKETTVVQTAHVTGYSRGFWQSADSLRATLRVRFANSNLTAISNGCGGTVGWDVYHGQVCVLSTSIELLMLFSSIPKMQEVSTC